MMYMMFVLLMHMSLQHNYFVNLLNKSFHLDKQNNHYLTLLKHKMFYHQRKQLMNWIQLYNKIQQHKLNMKFDL